MAKRVRAFISFAAEDERIRDLFVGQGKLTETPWEIADWSIHEPFTEKWKTQARERIRRTDVVIMLVGKNTWAAEGAIWEVNCGTGDHRDCLAVDWSGTVRVSGSALLGMISDPRAPSIFSRSEYLA